MFLITKTSTSHNKILNQIDTANKNSLMLFGATKLNNGGFGLSPSQLYQIRLRFWSVGVAKKNEVELVIILAKIVAILQARARVYFCKKNGIDWFGYHSSIHQTKNWPEIVPKNYALNCLCRIVT